MVRVVIFSNMNDKEKPLRSPCYDVLEWIVEADGSSVERIAARTMYENGITGDYQEQVLSAACVSCGMQDTCEYSDECGIGEIESKTPLGSEQRLPETAKVDVGKGYVRAQE
jgi:hypothetical protein